MIRNLETLILALMAAAALTAIGAPVASAQQGVLTSHGPVTLKGTQTGGELANSLTTFGETIACVGSTYTGHKVSATPHGLIQHGETTATVTPHYKDCTQPGTTRHVVVSMNGCDYVLNIGETTGGNHTYGATADIVCPEGQKIKFTIWNQATSVVLCEVTIGPQAGLSGAHLRQTTVPDDIDLIGAFEKIHAEKHGLCLFGATSTTSETKLHLDVTFQGSNEAGESMPISISHSRCD